MTSLVLLKFNVISFCQLTSISSDFTQGVSYPTSPGTDSLFVFYSNDAIPKKGSLTMIPFSAGYYSFSWSAYNSVTGSFNPPFYNVSNAESSTVNNLSEGGYKVRMRNENYDTTLVAWVAIDTFSVYVLKNNEGKVISSQYTCDFITLNGSISSQGFTYYDTTTNAAISIGGSYTFLWTSDNPDLVIPWPDTSLVSNRSFNPPFIDTWYYLTGTDNFGMKQKDSVFYESIVPKPVFSFQIYDKEEARDFIDPSGSINESAPLRVRFKNESINGSTYEWIFSDELRSGSFANEYSQDFDYQPEYTYYIPGDYYPALIVTSEEGCVDSVRVTDPVTIKPSLLEVMNVFSPDGDSYNDYFLVRHQSIKEFNIKIFNRYGKIVYKAEVKDMFEWEGWDGNILNTGKPASPGPYYYIIEASGWDAKKYHRNQYAGVVYLFRE